MEAVNFPERLLNGDWNCTSGNWFYIASHYCKNHQIYSFLLSWEKPQIYPTWLFVSYRRTRKEEMEIHPHWFYFISVHPWSSWSSISSLAKVFSGYPHSPESHQSSLTKGVSVQCSEPLQEHLVMLKMAMPDNIQWIWFCCICVFLHLYKQQKKLLLDIFVNVDNLGSPDYLNIIMNIDGSETYLNIQT